MGWISSNARRRPSDAAGTAKPSRSRRPTCWSREPGCPGVSVAGDIAPGAEVETGEKLTVELAPRGLIARRGLTEVGRMPDAAPEIVEAVRQACGVAVGTVEQVHVPAGVAEISIC